MPVLISAVSYDNETSLNSLVLFQGSESLKKKKKTDMMDRWIDMTEIYQSQLQKIDRNK